jgi:hypothetical protein
MFAAQAGHSEIAKLLLEKGAETDKARAGGGIVQSLFIFDIKQILKVYRK